MTGWLAAFLVTQLVEVPIYARALTHRRRWLLAALPSTLTHPIVYFAFPAILTAPIGGSYLEYVLLAEAFAVAAEALLLRALGVGAPVTWALVANLTSTAVGLALRQATGWP